MNFLGPPPAAEDATNYDNMTKDELKAMIEYFDELISLEILVEGEVQCSGSVFTVNKPEIDTNGNHLLQVISNFKSGGKNDFMRPDPVQLERSGDLLPRLYHGGGP